jgi:hypothetical protein
MNARLALSISLALATLALVPSTSLAQERASDLDDSHLRLTEPTLEVHREVRDDQVVARVFAELGMGVTAEIVGGTVGGFAGAGIASASAHEQFFSFSGLAGGLIGHGIVAAIILPLAVSWAGSWCDGRGDVWAAYVGELAGLAISGALLGAGFGTNDSTLSAVGMVSVLVLPLVGAIAGYEISDDVNRSASPSDTEEADASIAWMPTVAPTSDGQGVMLGASGAF